MSVTENMLRRARLWFPAKNSPKIRILDVFCPFLSKLYSAYSSIKSRLSIPKLE